MRVQLAEVTEFDLEGKVVHANAFGHQPVEYPYDSLIVAAGVKQSYFGNDQLALHAPGMKTLDDALELRRRILGAFEVAEMITDPTEKEHWLTIVVVGAGPTGVELAGQIRELATEACVANSAPSMRRPSGWSWSMAVPNPWPPSGTSCRSRRPKRSNIWESKCRWKPVSSASTASGVEIQGKEATSRIEARTTIWAAGVPASPLAGLLAEACGAEVDRAGRISVLPDLTLPGHPEVFAVGDMASLNDLPGVAEVAMQGGLHSGQYACCGG